MSMAEDSSKIIDLEIRINARPETVFPYLIDPDRMVMWMGDSVNLDPRPGGIYEVHVTGSNRARGEYIEVTPYSRVVFTFGWEGADNPVPPGSSRVEITLIPEGEGTLLRLRHEGLPSDEMRQAHSQGWNHYMDRLAKASAGVDPGPDPMASGDGG